MEHAVFLTILGVMGLLTLAVIILPLSNRLSLPFTVTLAAVGIVLGLLAHMVPAEGGLGFASDMIHALHRMEITSEAVFFVFLPALVFESALAIDVRRLMDDLPPILMLAVIGLLISTVVAGMAIYVISGQVLLVCLLLGAIVSATDPVAVVAIFKDLGAPKRLAILVEGESLFNDATAIVAFTILSSMILGESDPSLMGGVASFLMVFVGGIVVGYLLARLACWVLSWLGDSDLARTALTITLAYLCFIVAEHYLHVSGVMAVVTAACVLGSRGRSILSKSSWHSMEHVWEQLGFVANSVIFVLVGVAVPTIMGEMTSTQFMWLGVLLVTAFAARFAIIFGLLPLLARLGWSERVQVGYQFVMFWGGLRGAVSLALALAVMENEKFPEEVRSFIGIMVCGFVLFTLFVNATTVKFVMRAFGLDKLSPVDETIRDKVLARSWTELSDQLVSAAEQQGIEKQIVNRVITPFNERSQHVREKAVNNELSPDQQIRTGLRVLASHENQAYATYLEQGMISTEISRQLQTRVADLQDGIKRDSRDGYVSVYEQALRFNAQARLAARMQRQFGYQKWLARLLSDRYEILQATCMSLRDQLGSVIAIVNEVVTDEVSAQLHDIIEARLAKTNNSLRAIEATYPEYTAAVKERLLHRLADRMELSSYQRMLKNSTIGGEIYKDLVNEMARYNASHSINPRLDLGLDARKLVSKVPFFAGLSDTRQQAIAQMLQPRLVLPDEVIMNEGDKGDAMYFISSGAVKVVVEPEPVILGRGDFFGEMALLSDQPRKASVLAKGFCDLLTLNTRDFQLLMDADPDLRSIVERVAAERGA